VTRIGTVLLLATIGATGCASGVATAGANAESHSATRTTRVAIRSTHSKRPSASEVRGYRSGHPRAVRISSYGLRLPLGGNGCSPRGVSAQAEGSTLRLVFKPRHKGCTLQARFYEVTVNLSRPVLHGHRITTVTAQYRLAGKSFPNRKRVIYRLS
jgi:hypothetical protein